MLAIVTGTADGAHVTGEQYTPEDHARFINELVDNHAELDVNVRLLREDRLEAAVNRAINAAMGLTK